MSTTDPNELRTAFCRSLKAARERSGIALDQIAAVTKVCVAYYEALERGDLRHWPKAIFRRSFFRGYAEMIGVPVGKAMDEFMRLFPDDESAAQPETPALGTGHQVPVVALGTRHPAPVAAPDASVRLALDQSWQGPTTPIRSRAEVAGIDAGAVIALAILLWLLGLPFAVAVAVVSMLYFTLGRVFISDSPALHAYDAAVAMWQSPRFRAVRREPEPALAPSIADDEVPVPPEWRRAERRPWRSDARRVRPRDASSRVRVRFRVRPPEPPPNRSALS